MVQVLIVLHSEKGVQLGSRSLHVLAGQVRFGGISLLASHPARKTTRVMKLCGCGCGRGMLLIRSGSCHVRCCVMYSPSSRPCETAWSIMLEVPSLGTIGYHPRPCPLSSYRKSCANTQLLDSVLQRLPSISGRDLSFVGF